MWPFWLEIHETTTISNLNYITIIISFNSIGKSSSRHRPVNPGFDVWPVEARRALFTVSYPHPDIYLVVRIDKVLQGPLNACVEPYIRGEGKKRRVNRILICNANCTKIEKTTLSYLPFWELGPISKLHWAIKNEILIRMIHFRTTTLPNLLGQYVYTGGR